MRSASASLLELGSTAPYECAHQRGATSNGQGGEGGNTNAGRPHELSRESGAAGESVRLGLHEFRERDAPEER